jgi:hypothetical protein
MEEKFSYLGALKNFREAQKKFDYFFLGITLAFLSLSVQSFQINNDNHFNYLIIVAWIFLLVSFLCGFYRLEKMILIFSAETDIRESIEIKKKSSDSDYFKKGYKYLDKTNKKSEIAYKIQKWCFIASLFVFVLFKSINILIQNGV